ncbi:MAG: aromatic amino acid ammonia-lyase [Planctomycetota bacterium]
MPPAVTQRIASRRKTIIDGKPLDIQQIASVGRGDRSLLLSADEQVHRRMAESVDLVEHAVEQGWPVYGVTTGFGGMADQAVPCDQAAASQANLLSFLASGAGEPIAPRHVRAAMTLRANVLMQGYSGVRLEIVERLVRFVNANATPVVRELGSIGASGDLVPLSVIARAVTGESDFARVQLDGREFGSKAALAELGLSPIELRPKEGLAIVNGTSFSAAIAANCVDETRQLLGVAFGAQAMMLRALKVQDEPFEAFVHQRKPHPGQIWSAQIMHRLLNEGRASLNGSAHKERVPEHVQDRYSLRCFPQYMGPIVDGLAKAIGVIETEMNAVSDNPLVDADQGRFYQSGNFLGQYVGVAMDDLRRYLGLLAKHLDVQIASLVAPAFSNGLPSSLRGNQELSYNMGLKGLQITGNSIMPMLTYLGNPLVEHFPTHAEQFNQNINGLSWGAANFAWKSVELFQHYLSVALVFSVQAIDLRAKATLDHYDGRALLGSLASPLYSAVCEAMEVDMGRDRPLLFDDGDHWLEEKLAMLHASLRERSAVDKAVTPIVDSFDEQVAR